MNPFDEILDKSFLYLDADREMALAAMGNAVEQGQGLALCIGSSGIGKSAILTYLAEDLSARGCIVANDGQIVTCRPTLSFDEIEDIVRQSSVVDERPLVPEGGRVHSIRVLLMDDIERLSTVVLEHLSHWWRETAPLRETMTLVATAERKRTTAFAPSTIEAVETAADVRITLKALSRTDTEALIRHRLAAAGYQERELFTPSALDQVAFYGRGNPRRILQLCRAVYVLAHVQGNVPVSPELVKKCAHDVFLPPRLKDLARSTQHSEFDADTTNPSARNTHSSFDFGSTLGTQNPLIDDADTRYDNIGMAPSTAHSASDDTDDMDDAVITAPTPGGIASVAEPPTKRSGSSRPRIVYALTGVAFALGVFAGVAGTFLRNDEGETAARAVTETEREKGTNSKAPEAETESNAQANAERVAMAERMVAEALMKEQEVAAADAPEPVSDATDSDAASTTTTSPGEEDQIKDIVVVETNVETSSSMAGAANDLPTSTPVPPSIQVIARPTQDLKAVSQIPTSLEESTAIATTADPSFKPTGRHPTEPQLTAARKNGADRREANGTVPEAPLPDGSSAQDAQPSTLTADAPETQPVTAAVDEAANSEVAKVEGTGEAIVADATTAVVQPDELTPDSSNSEVVGEMATMAGGQETPVPLPASNAANSDPAVPDPEPATVVPQSRKQVLAPFEVETLPTAETLPESRRPVTTATKATKSNLLNETVVAIENTIDTRARAPASVQQVTGGISSPPDTIVASLPTDTGIATPTELSGTAQEETFVFDPRVRTAQLLLAQLGYKPGPVDGFEGKRTETAIRLFQRSKGIPETGNVTDSLIVALRNELVPVARASTTNETKSIDADKATKEEADTARTEEAEIDFLRECSRQQKQWIYVESLGRYIFCKRFQFNPAR